MDVTYEGLFRGICDNPDDNLLRQIIADWYEEQPTTVHCTSCNGLGYFTKNYGNIPCTKCGGRVINYGYANGTGQIQTGTKQRADFIRTQIAVEEALGEKKDSSTLTTQQVNALVLKMHNLWCESRTSVDVVRQIIAELPVGFSAYIYSDKYTLPFRYLFEPENVPSNYAFVRCGFVWCVCCTANTWLKCGPDILKNHPVTRVMFTDKCARCAIVSSSDTYDDTVTITDVAYNWIIDTNSESNSLPFVSENRIIGEVFFFKSTVEATDWASTVAIEWAKDKNIQEIYHGSDGSRLTT